MLGFFLASRKLPKSARGLMAGTPDITIAQKPVWLHSPAAQGPPASAADGSCLAPGAPTPSRCLGKSRGSTACRYHVELHRFFFNTCVLQALSAGLISRRWCGFCWLSICCFPIFREKGNPQRIFLLTLKSYSLFIASCSSCLVLKSCWVMFLFLSLATQTATI